MLSNNPAPPNRSKVRIAILVPIGYSGGSLRGAKLLAEALLLGSSRAGDPAEIVLAHLDLDDMYPEEEFDDLPSSILRRTYSWRVLNREESRRAMIYSGYSEWEPSYDSYMAPDDGMRQFLDSDLWVIVSDRLIHPILPVRPYILMVYDYIQRYAKILPNKGDYFCLHAAHHAKKVLVTTDFTKSDALNYASLRQSDVVKVPMLAPDFSGYEVICQPRTSPQHFIWTTNPAIHKNHENAIKALLTYYKELDGQLKCIVTGSQSEKIQKGSLPHLVKSAEIIKANASLERNLEFPGELSTRSYQNRLARAAFLWHPGRIDNGTFSVIESAYFGVPALSSVYPAMREIDEQFGLSLSWADAESPSDMARKLKYMETNHVELSRKLPSREHLQRQNVDALSAVYWATVRDELRNDVSQR